MEIGLFFGSFNPIHAGHLIIANMAVELSSIQKVWFVVSPQSPYKKKSSLLHEFDRYDMVRLAINDNPNFDVSDIEFQMPRPSYTVDTLAYLSDKYPQHTFRLIIGGDNLKSFRKWKNSNQILEQHGLLVYPRPGIPRELLPELPNTTYINAPLLDISATQIRQLLREGKSVKYLLSDEVRGFISVKGFYLD